MLWLLTPGMAAALAVYAYFVLGRNPSRTAWLPLVPALLAAAMLPLWLPADLPELRGCVIPPTIGLAAKAFEILRGRVHDPSTVATFPRFLTWFFLPADTRWPRSPEDIRLTRRAGWQRLARLLGKLPAILGMLTLASLLPSLHHWPLVSLLWALAMTYLCISSIADLLSGLVMLAGLHVAESFDSPLMARSPRDFWGRRWNRFVSTFAFRNIFLPLDGRRRPALAMAAVFFASGLAHEYLVLASLGGPGDTTGFMMAFFTVHGLATILEGSLARRRGLRPLLPRPIAIGVHTLWFVATAPLFFAPFHEIFGYTTWRLF
jgi:hypothetical protein